VSSARTADTNFVWVTGLRPDTAYGYRLLVDGEEWAAGERWDWGPVDRGGLDLRPGGRSYDTSFRTYPAPDLDAPLDFVVLGDYGVGIVSDSESSRRQGRVAEVLDRLVEQHGVRLVIGVGGNVYRGESGLVGAEGGGEDDDWYSSFYQPYRYLLARIPVYPTVSNHDSGDTESSDDREQIRDNFHTDERFLPAVGSGRASIEPGLFYRFDYGDDVEFVCVDTSLAEELPVEH
jgi:tartrate-resistant acid phosphatase type 5